MTDKHIHTPDYAGEWRCTECGEQCYPCPQCGGSGYIEWTATGMEPHPDDPSIAVPVPVPARDYCDTCGGYGWVE